MVVCRVALLDGTTFEPKGIDKNSAGQVVFEKIIKHLDIIETDYFGLTYRDKSGKKFWIDNSKKISQQVKGGTWVFEFQVKFYPPDPMSLKEDITRYQLCLQLRVDIFNGKLPCSFMTYALLGSYTVQSEVGSWDPVEFGNGLEYLHDFDFAPSQQPELLEKILELHKQHKGQTPAVAEAHFLENAKKLAMYGVDMHEAKDSENTDISLGVCASGILIYKDRLRINRFVWPKILKLSYKRNNFYIKVRPGEFEPHERTIGFKLDNHKLAKRLWKTCVEHHAFFRLKDADTPSSGTLFPRFNTKFRYSGRTAHQARKAAEQNQREEPHIQRTAERKSLIKDKHKGLDDETAHMKKNPEDESDMYDKKADPNATAELSPGGDASNLDEDGRYKTASPGSGDAKDRLDHRPGEEAGEEGPPGYVPDVSMLAEGGKKGKKDKDEEKRRKKEEEKRRKEEEKERKRLEKERKKHQGKGKETDIGGGSEPDPAQLEQMKIDFVQLLVETPDITSTCRLDDVKHKLEDDPRYKAVDSDKRREEWFNEYVNNMLKSDFMRLLQDTPTIHSQSTWEEARCEIDNDPRFMAVPTEAQREEWFNEYKHNLLKSEFMMLLKDTPSVHSQSRWDGVKEDLELDPRYQAVPTENQRKDWFDEYIQNLKKEEFMQLLRETPSVTCYSRYSDVRQEIDCDPRFHNVDSEAQREEYFNEHIQNLKKEGFTQLLRDTPDIRAYCKWHESKAMIDTDPRYHAVDTDAQRARWFNEYVNMLAGIGYGSGFGMKIGDYKSIDRKLQFIPVDPPSVTVKGSREEPMPFFEPAGESDTDPFGNKKIPPPVAKKPKGPGGYDSEEDGIGVPVTVETERYKYNPDEDIPPPVPTSNIPIVETKTQTVTYEKDGIPIETEESILISAHSVTTKSQTIDTTTYKTDRNGVTETIVERKITVTSDENDDFDHDALLRAAIEEVTNMNPDLSVERIECMRQIEQQ